MIRTCRASSVVGNGDVEDVESGTSSGSDVMADVESGIAVGGVGDVQHGDVMASSPTVSGPASSDLHVSQATCGGGEHRL